MPTGKGASRRTSLCERSLVLEALGHGTDLDRSAGLAAGSGDVLRTPTQVKSSVARSSGSPSSAGTSESRKVMPVALAPSAYAARCSRPSTSAGRELRLAVAAVVERRTRGGRDDDVRGVGAERLVQADPLAARPAGRPSATGDAKVGPAVDAGRHVVDAVHDDPVRHVDAA